MQMPLANVDTLCRNRHDPTTAQCRQPGGDACSKHLHETLDVDLNGIRQSDSPEFDKKCPVANALSH